ncbi:MAG TPA: hypothetical protein VNE18_10355 [Rhodanobacter sp.]|nr:hypothetical protein [Rhodanobacter sp.]
MIGVGLQLLDLLLQCRDVGGIGLVLIGRGCGVLVADLHGQPGVASGIGNTHRTVFVERDPTQQAAQQQREQECAGFESK